MGTGDARSISGMAMLKAMNKSLECMNSAIFEDFIAGNVVYIDLRKKSNPTFRNGI